MTIHKWPTAATRKPAQRVHPLPPRKSAPKLPWQAARVRAAQRPRVQRVSGVAVGDASFNRMHVIAPNTDQRACDCGFVICAKRGPCAPQQASDPLAPLWDGMREGQRRAQQAPAPVAKQRCKSCGERYAIDGAECASCKHGRIMSAEPAPAVAKADALPEIRYADGQEVRVGDVYAHSLGNANGYTVVALHESSDGHRQVGFLRSTRNGRSYQTDPSSNTWLLSRAPQAQPAPALPAQGEWVPPAPWTFTNNAWWWKRGQDGSRFVMRSEERPGEWCTSSCDYAPTLAQACAAALGIRIEPASPVEPCAYVAMIDGRTCGIYSESNESCARLALERYEGRVPRG